MSRLTLLLALTALVACGPASAPAPEEPAPVVTPPVTPPPPAPEPVGALAIPGGARLLEAGATLRLTATEDGAPTAAVRWSLEGGAGGGSVAADGTLTAPVVAGEYTVVATSTKDASKRARVRVSVPLGVAASGLRAAVSAHRVGLREGQTVQLLLQVTDPAGSFTPGAQLAATGLPAGVTAEVQRVDAPAGVLAALADGPSACQVEQVGRVPPSYLYRVWLSRQAASPPPPPEAEPVGFVLVGSSTQLPAGVRICSIDNGQQGCDASQMPRPFALTYDSQPWAYTQEAIFTGDRSIVATAFNDRHHAAVAEVMPDGYALSLWRGSAENTVALERQAAEDQYVYGVNGADTVVGYVRAPERTARLWRVTDETPETLAGVSVERVTLGHLPQGTWSVGRAVNAAETVVGEAGTPERPEGVPFVWSAGTMLELHPHFRTLEADASVKALDVNAGGDVLVVATRGNACATSWLWQRGVLRQVGASGTPTWAVALNDSGVVVGDTLADGFFKGFTWKDGTLSLLDLPNEESHALDVNDHGDVLATMGHAEFTEHLLIEGDVARPVRSQWQSPTKVNNHRSLLGDYMLLRRTP